MPARVALFGALSVHNVPGAEGKGAPWITDARLKKASLDDGPGLDRVSFGHGSRSRDIGYAEEDCRDKEQELWENHDELSTDYWGWILAMGRLETEEESVDLDRRKGHFF